MGTRTCMKVETGIALAWINALGEVGQHFFFPMRWLSNSVISIQIRTHTSTRPEYIVNMTRVQLVQGEPVDKKLAQGDVPPLLLKNEESDGPKSPLVS